MVPKQACKVEEEEKDHKRIPHTRGASTIPRIVSLWSYERRILYIPPIRYKMARNPADGEHDECKPAFIHRPAEAGVGPISVTGLRGRACRPRQCISG